MLHSATRKRVETWPGETLARGAGAPCLGGTLYMDAVLRPNRSLPNAGFTALMAVLGLVSFGAGILFVSMGAWPVFGFFGLDVLLVYVAFRLSYRAGRLREEVRIAGDAAEIVRVLPGGQARIWRAAPALARVEVDKPMKHDGQVRLVSSGRTLVLGAFLSPPERESFGHRLRGALDAARSERWTTGG
jgi:uncharacterized membrane protein